MTGFWRWTAWLSRLAFLCVLILAVFSVRVISEGESELRASDAAFDRGDLSAALDHARRSATLYAPGAPHVARAYERLNAIALGAEAAGDPKTAYSAWQAMRSAALESRHVLIVKDAELERANRNLARLEALARDQGEAERAKRRSEGLRRLSADDAPAPLSILLLATGFLLALAGLALFAFRGLDRSGRLAVGRARLGLLLFVFGAACWTWAAYQA